MSELRKRISFREYEATLAWLDLQWERPDRRDWYLMSVAAEVRQKFNSHPVEIGDMKLKFKSVEAEVASEYDATAFAKAKALSRVGPGVTCVTITRSELERIRT